MTKSKYTYRLPERFIISSCSSCKDSSSPPEWLTGIGYCIGSRSSRSIQSSSLEESFNGGRGALEIWLINRLSRGFASLEIEGKQVSFICFTLGMVTYWGNFQCDAAREERHPWRVQLGHGKSWLFGPLLCEYLSSRSWASSISYVWYL
jgi:hypothetical protein